jgi:tetratricopeptide (TPR) repeat protein
VSRHGRQLDRLAQLEEERRFLLRSLDDLDREYAAGDVDEADYQTLRDGYTARAAAVIREIAAGQAALPPRRPTRWGRVAAITAAAVAVAVFAGWLVARYSGQDVPEGAEVQSSSDQVAQLLAEARQAPLGESLAIYDDVLAIEPDNVEALTYRAWALRFAAQVVPDPADRQRSLDAAVAGLERAVAVDPAYPDAHCFLAVVRFRDLGDAVQAKQHLDACIAANPPAVVRDLVTALGADIDAALAG